MDGFTKAIDKAIGDIDKTIDSLTKAIVSQSKAIEGLVNEQSKIEETLLNLEEKLNSCTSYQNMTDDMTREELKAHLENQDLKVDARLKEFQQAISESTNKIVHQLDFIKKDIESVKGIKGVVITTAIASVLAIVATIIGLLAYGTSEFDSGRETSQLIQEVRQEVHQQSSEIDKIKAQQQAPKAAESQPAQ